MIRASLDIVSVIEWSPNFEFRDGGSLNQQFDRF